MLVGYNVTDVDITNVDVIGDVIDDVMWSRNRLYILLVLRNSRIPIYAILVAGRCAGSELEFNLGPIKSNQIKFIFQHKT